jgi:hypothetical protein
MEFNKSCAKCSEDAESAQALFEIFTNKETKSEQIFTYISQRAIPADLVWRGDFFRLPSINVEILKDIWATRFRFNCQDCERSITHQDYEFSSIFEETIRLFGVNQEISQLIAETLIKSILWTVDTFKQDEWFIDPLLGQILNSDEFSSFLYGPVLPNESRVKLKAALTKLSEFEQDFIDAGADSGSGEAGDAVFQNAAAYLDEPTVDTEIEGEGENEAHDKEIQEIDASDPNLSHDLQKLVSKSEVNYERSALAENPGVIPEILIELSTDQDEMVRSSVAANPSIPGEVLDRLSSDPSILVLSKVASNPKSTADMLNKLITQSFSIESDDIYDGEIIRMEAASNPNLPKELIISLSKDPSASVQSYVAANSSTPIELLQKFVEDNGEPFNYYEASIRSGVAINPSCPINLLEQLAKDENAEVRAGVAQNQNASMEVLTTLAADTDDAVSYWISKRSEASELGLDKTAERARFGPVLESK